MPEAPVAAPVPSAPAAAPSAPAPAAPAPAAPSAPAPPAAPAPVAPSAPAAAPVAPEKFNPETAAAPPKKSDYPDNQAGLDKFIEDSGSWSLLHPEEANKLRSQRFAEEDGDTTAEAPAESIAEAVAKVEDTKPEGEKPPAAEAVAAATPAVVDEWVGKSPELKAAFDKSPELRSAIMEMARVNEAAKPVLDIVSTPEEAQFAVEHANRLVSLQTNWMLSSEDPEMIGPAWDQTVEMFKERDQNGKEILENGKPKLGADFQPFVRKAAASAMTDFSDGAKGQIAALEAKLQGVYPNEAAREADEDALENAKYELAAFDFVMNRLNTPGETSTLPALPANATEEQKAFQKQLEEKQRKLDEQQGKTTASGRKAAREATNKDVQRSLEVGLNDYIETRVNEMKERGEYLPEFVLQDKWINPRTGATTNVSAFGAKLYLALDAKVKSNPIHMAKLASLEALGAAGKDARIAEVKRLRELYLPKLFDAEVKRIQDGIRGAAKKPAAGVVDPTGNNAGKPRVEPQSAGTVVPQSMNDAQLRTWAEGEAAKTPGFSGMSRAQQEETILSLQYAKKYGG